MIEKIKKVLTIFDLPSGVILGLHTSIMIGLSIAAFVLKRPIDASIQTVYGVVLGAFFVHKTVKVVKESTETTQEEGTKK